MNAVITGASKGIGKAIALRLAAEGYDIAICARKREGLELTAEELRKLGVSVLAITADCSKKADVKAFCAAVKLQWKTIDVLVNNAGIFLPGSLLDEPEDNFEQQLALNLTSAYHFSRFFGKMMRARQTGHIFNICSVASLSPIENAGSYSVTKSALLSLNHVMRKELAEHSVKVTAILPGQTITSSWEGTSIPEDKFVQPEDIAKMLYTALSLSSGANVEEILIRPQRF